MKSTEQIPNLEERWQAVVDQVAANFQQEPDLKAVLFLIGIRETGSGKKEYTKEQKEDFMNLGVCKILSLSGYFEQKGTDQEGWPEWKQHKAFPKLELKEQEDFLKAHVVMYFEQEGLLSKE